MSQYALVEVKMGISNCFHDQVNRTHNLLIDDDNLEKIFSEITLGNPLSSIAGKVGREAGQLNYQADDIAFIEEGWRSENRGICSLKLVSEDPLSPLNINVCVVIGYVAGGQLFDGNIPEDLRFIPVKSYCYTERTIGGAGGLPETAKLIFNINQFELKSLKNNNRDTLIRPEDIVNTGVVSALVDEKESFATGFTGNGDVYLNDVVPGGSDIRISKIASSKYRNNNTTAYATDLIKLGLNVSEDVRLANNSISASLANHGNDVSLLEDSLSINPFYNIINRTLGPSALAEHGISFGDIGDVFPTYYEPGVINTVLVESGNTILDYTENTNEFGTSDPKEVLSIELAFTLISAMFDNRLININLYGTNAGTGLNDPSDEIIPNTGIYLYGSNAIPLLDYDNHIIKLQENVINKVTNDFLFKYFNKPFGEQLLFNFEVECNIYTDVIVKIWGVEEDESNAHIRAIPVFADNRFSAVYSCGDDGSRLGQYFDQIKNIINM